MTNPQSLLEGMISTWDDIPGAVGVFRDRTPDLITWAEQRFPAWMYPNIAILLGPSDESALLLYCSNYRTVIGHTLWHRSMATNDPTAWQASITLDVRAALRDQADPSTVVPAWGWDDAVDPETVLSLIVLLLTISLTDGHPITRPSVGELRGLRTMSPPIWRSDRLHLWQASPIRTRLPRRCVGGSRASHRRSLSLHLTSRGPESIRGSADDSTVTGGMRCIPTGETSDCGTPTFPRLTCKRMHMPTLLCSKCTTTIHLSSLPFCLCSRKTATHGLSRSSMGGWAVARKRPPNRHGIGMSGLHSPPPIGSNGSATGLPSCGATAPRCLRFAAGVRATMGLPPSCSWWAMSLVSMIRYPSSSRFSCRSWGFGGDTTDVGSSLPFPDDLDAARRAQIERLPLAHNAQADAAWGLLVLAHRADVGADLLALHPDVAVALAPVLTNEQRAMVTACSATRGWGSMTVMHWTAACAAAEEPTTLPGQRRL